MKVKARTNIGCDKGFILTGEIFEIDAKEFPEYSGLVEVLEDKPAVKEERKEPESKPAPAPEPERKEAKTESKPRASTRRKKASE